MPRQEGRQIDLGRERVEILGAIHPLSHLEHLARQRLRLWVLSLLRHGVRQIERSSKPLVIVLHTVAYQRAP